MTDDRSHIIDRARSATLYDVGAVEFDAAVVVDTNGDNHLALIRRSGVADPAIGFSLDSPPHEQLGPLPLNVVQRIAIARRTTPDERTEQP